MTRAVMAVALTLAALTLVACGQTTKETPAPPPAAATASPTPASSTPASPCGGALPLPTLTVSSGAQTIPVVILGAGPVVVVLSNQSDEDMCSWLAFARKLVAAHFRVALWDYGGASPPDELAAVTAAVRHGSDRVILIGASKGAKTSLITARRLDADYLIGVVCLSAEATLNPDIDVAKAAAGLATPTLLITADDDPYGSAEALEPIRRGLAHARVLTVPGAKHGTALLDDATVTDRMLSFLRTATNATPANNRRR